MQIAIIGAGIGGLTLAARLKQITPATIKVTLFECDEAAFSRPQGYAIGLKVDGGLPVLTELGLRDEVLGNDALKVTNFVFTDQAGRELLALPSRDGKHLTYRVQRRHLKEVLLKAIGDTPIQFGKVCSDYEQTADGVKVAFSDGSSATADYVIGCDGVASSIRQQMIGDNKRYLGLVTIVGEAKIKINHPLLDGDYFMTLNDNGSSMFVYRQPNGIHFSYTLPAADEASMIAKSKVELLDIVKTGSKDWHELIQQIVGAVDEKSLLVRGYYDKQPAQKVRDGNIWLLGDAAHSMCPFQGQGVNKAMVDAHKIADYLAAQAKAPQSGETIVTLEVDILKRGRKAILESRNAALQFHTTSSFKRFNRNIGFRIANAMIRIFSKH